jgi:poly-gamma-glutamate synthesis protein (capsule biosynthesis protein)
MTETAWSPLVSLRNPAGPSGRILFTGDLCPIGRVEANLLTGDVESVFSSPILELFSQSRDVCINMESPLCSTLAPIKKIGPNFSASPAVAEQLRKAGITAASLANNHIMDQGVPGLSETIRNLKETGIKCFGAGISHDLAAKPVTVETQAGKCALLNFAEGEFAQAQGNGPGAARFAGIENLRAVADAAADYPVVIAVVHAGNEHVPFPAPYYQDWYRGMIDAGAAAVVAHHPHIVQGAEIYRNGFIFYSLGNFLFDYSGHTSLPHTETGFILGIRFDTKGIHAVELFPYRKSPSGGISLLPEGRRAGFFEYLNDVSRPLSDRALLTDYWEQEAASLFRSMYRKHLAESGDLLPRDKETAEFRQSLFYNLFRCDAHRHAIETACRLLYEGKMEEREDGTGLQQKIDELKKAAGAF